MTTCTRLWRDGEDSERGTVSCTQLQSMLGCPRKWSYAYLEGLRPRRERSCLTVGRLVHRGFEAAMRLHAEGCEDVDAMVSHGLLTIKEESEAQSLEFEGDRLDVLSAEAKEACEVFMEALPEFDPTRWEVMSVEGVPALELHFVTPCPPTEGLHGYVDAVLRERSTGQVWCVDYKFRSRLSSDDDERFSLQRAVYARACRDLGLPVTGTLTWQRLRRCEARPRPLRDGTMSRAKVQCTWTTYRRALLDAGLDPHDYADMEVKLSGVSMSREVRELRSDVMLDRVWSQVVEPMALRVQYRRGQAESTGDPSGVADMCVPALDPFRCRVCPYSELCQAELRGYDADFVRAESFTVADWARQ